jgi:hypothetical protein
MTHTLAQKFYKWQEALSLGLAGPENGLSFLIGRQESSCFLEYYGFPPPITLNFRLEDGKSGGLFRRLCCITWNGCNEPVRVGDSGRETEELVDQTEFA